MKLDEKNSVFPLINIKKKKQTKRKNLHEKV